MSESEEDGEEENKIDYNVVVNDFEIEDEDNMESATIRRRKATRQSRREDEKRK